MSNMDVVRKYLAGERPYLTITTHVTEKEKYRNEGEEWVLDGIKYKKLNGKTIKLTKTQGDIIRQAIDDALDCKLCSAQWKWANNNDRKYLTRTGLCADCLIDYETKLRIAGIYDSYEKYRMASYELGFLKDKKEKLDEVIEYFNKNDGDIVKMAESEYDEHITWKNTNKDKILGDAVKDFAEVKKLIKNGKKIVGEYKKAYVDNIKKYNLPNIINK